MDKIQRIFENDKLYSYPNEDQESETIERLNKPFAVVYHKETGLVGESELTLLSKIMGAVGLNEENSVVIPAEMLNSFKVLGGSKELKQVLLFGVNPGQLGWNKLQRKHAPILYREKELLFTYGLDELAMDEKKKRALWSALKQFLNLS